MLPVTLDSLIPLASINRQTADDFEMEFKLLN